jgi:alkylation response protein AidB-like acyl-CoA dehydrogenase
MEFALSKAQQLLQESARALLARVCPSTRVRRLMEGDTEGSDAIWQTLIEEGWLGMHVPEEHGGLGLSPVELAVVAEEMGRACLPGPFLANVWAATLLAACPEARVGFLQPLLEGKLKASVAWLEEEGSWGLEDIHLRSEEVSGGYRLHGAKTSVLDAGVADVLLCVTRLPQGPAILSVPVAADGLRVRETPAIDATRKIHDIDFSGVFVPSALAIGDAARVALEQSIRLTTMVLCAELVGVIQRVLEMTVEYAKNRQQFGRPIGAYQAVQHQCADMLLWTESARSAAYFAAWALSASSPEADRAVAVAKAYCSDAARETVHRAVQVHGGIGMTWEHDLSLSVKRVRANEFLLGDSTFHRERLAQRVLDRRD